MSDVIQPSTTIDSERDINVAIAERNRAATANSMAEIYSVVSAQLKSVESTIVSELHSDSPEVETLLTHSRELGGKRLRPALVLLCGKAAGKLTEGHIFAAASLEMIHLATLIHDDVLDDAKHRRHQQTAHAKFGLRPGVLLGDYLFTHSFSVGSKSNSIEAVQMLAQASNLVCEGEIKQNAWQSDFTISEADYLKMVSEKTGELCAVGCSVGAILSGADAKTAAEYAAFGRDIGTAFQIIDDVLDLVGDPQVVGKTLGTDLQNRKITLPLIHALKTLDGPRRTELLAIVRAETVAVDDVVAMLADAGSITYAREVAQSIVQRAIGFAKGLESSEASEALLAISTMLLQRTY